MLKSTGIQLIGPEVIMQQQFVLRRKIKAGLALLGWSQGLSHSMVQAWCHLKGDPNTVIYGMRK